MDFKADALALKAVDYGENDRMVTLLTAERGKIGAGMKGVKKAGARLRFAAQPFCFAEYVFAVKGGRYTVTQATLHDGFYALRERVERYYAAAGVAEVCDALSYEGMESGGLLVAAVEALGRLTDTDDVRTPMVTFLLRACAAAGYPVTAGDCPICGKAIRGRRYFDLDGGAFGCAACGVGVPASESTYDAVRAAYGRGEATADGERRALRLLTAYLTRKTETEFPALSGFLTVVN